MLPEHLLHYSCTYQDLRLLDAGDRSAKFFFARRIVRPGRPVVLWRLERPQLGSDVTALGHGFGWRAQAVPVADLSLCQAGVGSSYRQIRPGL